MKDKFYGNLNKDFSIALKPDAEIQTKLEMGLKGGDLYKALVQMGIVSNNKDAALFIMQYNRGACNIKLDEQTSEGVKQFYARHITGNERDTLSTGKKGRGSAFNPDVLKQENILKKDKGDSL